MQGDTILSHFPARYLGLMGFLTALVLARGASAGVQFSRSFEAGAAPHSVVVADLDGDTIPDIVVANQFIDGVSVLLGNGDGSFQAHVSFAAGDSRSPRKPRPA